MLFSGREISQVRRDTRAHCGQMELPLVIRIVRERREALEKIHCRQWPASFENGIALVRRIIWIRLILSPRQPMQHASKPVAAEIGRQPGCECLRNRLGPILQKTELLAGLISLEVKSSIIKSLN